MRVLLHASCGALSVTLPLLLVAYEWKSNEDPPLWLYLMTVVVTLGTAASGLDLTRRRVPVSVNCCIGRVRVED
jgi:hypothetical protein